jgi:hypothetical protein
MHLKARLPRFALAPHRRKEWSLLIRDWADSERRNAVDA